jgi:hypothetical protein
MGDWRNGAVSALDGMVVAKMPMAVASVILGPMMRALHEIIIFAAGMGFFGENRKSKKRIKAHHLSEYCVIASVVSAWWAEC